MPKTESTAVNSLIERVQSNQATPIIDPADDLFAAPRSGANRPSVKPAALPLLREGAAAPPVRPSRAPGGTSPLTLPGHHAAVSPPPRGEKSLADGTPPPAIQARSAAPPRARSSGPIPAPVPAAARDMSPDPARTQVGVSDPAAPRRARAATQRTSASMAAVRPSPAPARAPTSPVAADSAIAPATAVDLARGTRVRTSPPAARMRTRAASPSAKQGYARAQTGPANVASIARIDRTGDMVRGEEWFEASRVVEKFEDETYVGTSPHVLQDRRADGSLVKKLILPGIGFIVVGAVIGGFIALHGNGKTRPVAKAPVGRIATTNQPTAQNTALAAQIAHGANTGVATPPSASAPVAAAAPVGPAPERMGERVGERLGEAAGRVVRYADVRIDSVPAGATVTLVENTATGDKPSFLGTTPISTSLDASHAYQVVLSLPGHADQTAKLDPVRTPRLRIALASTVGRAAAAPAPRAVAIAKKAPPRGAAANPQIVDPGFDAPDAPEAPTAGAAASAAEGGNGTLMISSKPPCEIEIDGKATGLRTPQRALALAAGPHKVTLINGETNVNKTLMVQINAGQATKLVRDLTGD